MMVHLIPPIDQLEKNVSNIPECTSFYLVLVNDLLFPCCFFPNINNPEALLLAFTKTSYKPLSGVSSFL